MLLTFITRITFWEDVRFRFWTLFDTQLINFIRKYFIFLKAYLHYKFTMQRVNEASFFEVTSSRSCEDVKGFHNVTLRQQYLAQWFLQHPKHSEMTDEVGVFR